MENESHSVTQVVCERDGDGAPVRSEEEAGSGETYTGDPERNETGIGHEAAWHDVHRPPGSTFHVLHAEPETVTALATIDWNRHFRRGSLDPVRGLITLMSPSFSHEDLTGLLDDIVEIAGEKLAGTVRVLRSTRLRRRGDPPGSDLRKLDASWVLGGLTPEDVCETVEGVRDGETRDDRTKAVERIVQRRQDGSVRVREKTAAYSAGQAATEHEPDAARAAPENVHMDDAVPHRPGQRAT